MLCVFSVCVCVHVCVCARACACACDVSSIATMHPAKRCVYTYDNLVTLCVYNVDKLSLRTPPSLTPSLHVYQICFNNSFSLHKMIINIVPLALCYILQEICY